MDDAAFIPLGRVVKPHGLSGELSVKLEPGVGEVPAGVEIWFVPPPDVLRRGRVHSVRRGPKGPLVSVEGIDDVAAAETVRGCTILARLADLPDDVVLPEPAPVGARVIDSQRGELGLIEEVIRTGANDVWVVRGGPFGEVLIPVIDEVVLRVDPDEATVHVRLIPGLIEDE